MKAVSFPLALQTVVAALFFPAVANAADMGGGKSHRTPFQAKVQYCLDCHGPLGKGWHGYFPIPRLAGQTSEYFQTQLAALAGQTREKIPGLNMSKAHGFLSPATQAALAEHFEDLEVKASGGGPGGLVEAGKKIFEEGIPEANVPACSACHGPEAMGAGVNPRLAGQLYPYMVKELVNWSKERTAAGESTAAIMAPIAQSMSRQQIEAVSAYLSHLK
jgi:cytochrome c553